MGSSLSPKIEIEGLDFSFAGKTIFKDLEFFLTNGDAVILVGENGIGKSIFLKILAGELEAVSSRLFIRGTIGYLPQNFEDHLTNSLIEFVIKQSDSDQLIELLNKNRNRLFNDWQSEFAQLGGYACFKNLSDLGIGNLDFDRKISTLSGGEKTKVFLSSLVLLDPDILLLDEPTNHLDGRGIRWLETFIRNHSGITVMATHDRALINQTANTIAEINRDAHAIKYFRGGYSNYIEMKEKERIRLEQTYQNQKKELKSYSSKLHQINQKTQMGMERDIKDRDKLSFNAKGEKKQKSSSRISRQIKNRIEKIEDELVTVPKKKPEIGMKLDSYEFQKNITLEVKNLAFFINDSPLFEELSFFLNQGDRLVIQGENGIGKTTLLNIIAGKEKNFSGAVQLPNTVRMGFLDQEQELLDLGVSPIELLAVDRRITLSEGQIVQKLLDFGIYRKEDHFTLLEDLSVGARRKVQLAQILLAGCDVLLLDEPTNHIDLFSIEKLEEILLQFSGIIIAVSHDRFFMKKVSTKQLNLQKTKK